MVPDFDEDTAALHAAMKAAGMPRFETLTPDRARAFLAESRRAAAKPPEPCHEVSDHASDGLRLRLYRPVEGLLPLAVFLHGGGWVIGDLDSHDAFCRRLANASGAAVVAVDYRLAPEHPFPAALEDAASAVRWAAENAASLGLDGSRLAVLGDSAGGNLAAAAALMARDGALPALRLQMLLCPVLDATLAQPSQALDIEGLPVNGPTMRWFRDLYMGDADPRDWRASPLLADALAGVAPVSLVTAGVDPLCDEGLAYAARLAREGVAVTHRHFPGQMHGFLTAGLALPRAQSLIRLLGLELAQALGVET